MAKKAFRYVREGGYVCTHRYGHVPRGPILKATSSNLTGVCNRGARHASRHPAIRARNAGKASRRAHVHDNGFPVPVGPSSYCAAKTAATSIMMSLANELGPVKEHRHIHLYLPAGGRQHTPQFRSSSQSSLSSECIREASSFSGYEG